MYKSSAKNADLIETKINKKFGRKLAFAVDTRSIRVNKPEEMSIIKFISMIENIPLSSEFKKKIIIDINRESVIAGADIPISPVTIARDSFTIRIKKSSLNEPQWNDPKYNKGVDVGDDVTIADKPAVDINNAMINTKRTPTVSDLVRAMKVMKLPMTEIIDTLKMIKEMGAIDVEFEIRG